MKKIKFIDGPNLNLLGKREPEIYGSETLDDIHKLVNSHIEEKKYDIVTTFFQSNSEGEIVDCVQSSNQTSDGLIINAAGFSHTSVALLDSLLAIEIPKIEITKILIRYRSFLINIDLLILNIPFLAHNSYI